MDNSILSVVSCLTSGISSLDLASQLKEDHLKIVGTLKSLESDFYIVSSAKET